MTKLKLQARSVLAIALLAALAACKNEEDPLTKAEAALLAQPRMVRVQTLGAGETVYVRSFPGRVEAVQTTDLSFEVAGRLIELPLLEGQKVEKGELIAAIDPTDYQLAVDEAIVRLRHAEQELDRLKELFSRKVISEKQLDAAKTDYDLAGVVLENADTQLERTRIFAPYDALVTRKMVDNFTNIAAGSPVVRLQDVSEVRVAVNAPETLFARAAHADVLAINGSFLAVPSHDFALQYREHSTEIDPVSQTYRTILAMPQTKEADILPGMTASVTVSMQERGVESGLSVPVSALDMIEGTSRLWVFDGETAEVHPRLVSIGLMGNEQVEITGGVKAGELVVTAGVTHLVDGMKVVPIAEE